MESEAAADRPESPKKKVKSNPSADSEAQSSDYCASSRSAENKSKHASNEINGIGHGIAPTRKRSSFKPDSSSDRIITRTPADLSPRVQEEEVSSSENSVFKTKNEGSDSPAEGDADSLSTVTEDLTSVCDSASSNSSDKH